VGQRFNLVVKFVTFCYRGGS